MTAAVECAGVGKTFAGGQVALRDVDLVIPAGTVHGLVGQNGAGKTTLMKILTGTVVATAGQTRVLGRPAGHATVAARVGSLIEEPAFYPYLSGRQNLEVLGRYFGVGAAEVDQRLDQVGLGERASSPFGGYSLGMKQRLGIAAALLGDPELLVLDEPTNGLDPHAIVQLRELIAQLRVDGRTVLVSSHLLAEVEQMCEMVTIIHEGAVIQEGTVSQIRSMLSPGSHLVVEVDDAGSATTVLSGLPGLVDVQQVAPGTLVVQAGDVSPGEITRALVRADVAVLAVHEQETSLEDLYLELTRGTTSGQAIKARRT
ncbi:ABC transporter ATP-binding protein [Modestobacter sp. VKM Ac-2977]|uniref:ABC transporter ATP-binding protein n=1 Tax=Modestobacter sp. VKM Ac-2977 TaxID=3004131 RepID=UPI0022AB097C|nr:ABC transporter ATP-binding protein [Modestobacter sp. VKM Ac-2977]MCZ2819837.1 ABC transporter ATP-binding protein [Modestobacter sp. VKM Ac-2977]